MEIDDGGSVRDLASPDEIVVLYAVWKKALYCVVDLETGKKTYIVDKPESGWSDADKTKHLVLRRIEAGSFTMGCPERDEYYRQSVYSWWYQDENNLETRHEVVITDPFYIGVFEVTQEQWALLTGEHPSFYEISVYNKRRPVEQVSYNEITNKFMPKLNALITTGRFDFPTEAQWEYACRAGTFASYNDGSWISSELYDDDNLRRIGRFDHTEGAKKSDTLTCGTEGVGRFVPNEWGLYDMHGNVEEFVKDWFVGNLGSSRTVNPIGAKTGVGRCARGGHFDSYTVNCRCSSRRGIDPDETSKFRGVRVVFNF